MKPILVFLLIVVAALACIPLVPLKAAVNMLQLERFGFTASDIQGNLWSGQMYDAKFGKVALGDVTSSLSLGDLAKGRVKLQVAGTDETSALKGAFSYGLGGLGLEGFSMGMPTMAGAPPLGGLTVFVNDLNVRFPGGECTDGTGTARAYIAGAVRELGMPDQISGPAICRDGHLTFDLTSDSGRERQEIILLGADRYRVRVTVQQSMPQIVQTLRSNGFVAKPEGYVYETERSL